MPTESPVLPSDTPMAGRRWATITQTATYLKLTTHTVREMIKDGRINGYRGFGSGCIRIDLDEVDATLVASC